MKYLVVIAIAVVIWIIASRQVEPGPAAATITTLTLWALRGLQHGSKE